MWSFVFESAFTYDGTSLQITSTFNDFHTLFPLFFFSTRTFAIALASSSTRTQCSQNYMTILLEPSRDYECTKKLWEKINLNFYHLYMSPQDWFAETNYQRRKYEHLCTQHQNSKTLHLIGRSNKIYICICYEIIIIRFNHFFLLLLVFIT